MSTKLLWFAIAFFALLSQFTLWFPPVEIRLRDGNGGIKDVTYVRYTRLTWWYKPQIRVIHGGEVAPGVPNAAMEVPRIRWWLFLSELSGSITAMAVCAFYLRKEIRIRKSEACEEKSFLV